MLTTIYNAIAAFTNWAWSLPILFILIGGGIWLTIACDFVQFKHFGAMIRMTIGDAFHGKKDGDGISSLQAVTAALSATLGTGNIVGVGTAIALGGPGAILWMWIVGLIAMALKYAEAVLAVHTRFKDANGNWKGGAHHYLSMVWKPMGYIWAVCVLYNMLTSAGVHTGSVVTAGEGLGIPPMVSTVAVVIIVTVILFGGLKTLVKITDKLVPFMTLLYIGAGLLVIFLNIGNLIPAFLSIFTGALTGTAAVGGFAGAAVSAAIRNGCARGVYSSDAGNGVSSLVHSQADTDDPVKQGMWGIFEVFVDTIIVCTFTAMVILCTGVWTTGDPGSVLAINAFTSGLGSVGRTIASLGLLLFAGSTVLSFCTYVGLVSEDLFGRKVRWLVQIAFVVLAFVGGTIGVDKMLMWGDFGNLFTLSLNVIGMLVMSKDIRKLTIRFFKDGTSSII